VRELGNLIERLSILCPDRKVDLDDLPAKYRPVGMVEDLLHEIDLQIPEPEPLLEDDLHAGQPLSADAEHALFNDHEAIALLTEDGTTLDTAMLAQLPPDGLDLRDHLYTIERNLIRQALNRAGGTVAHAARLLKLRRTTLVEKLRKFEMLNEAAASEV
jgi:sigma-54 specific flagellar transcriptional regulator A